MACGCMRGTVSPCHVALSEDTRLLVRVRPCGPCSTIFERRSRSRWHEPTRSAARGAETGCAPGKFETTPKSSATGLDLMPTVRSFGIVVGRISLLANYAKVQRQRHVSDTTATRLRVPCLRLCVCQPACVGRYRVPARACGALHRPLVRECPALFCACLPCACACALSALGRQTQSQ